MSNEELVARIQDGDKQLYAELWEQVRRWVICLARRRLPTDGSTNKIELEDLTQAGYIAMVDAVKAFDRNSGNGFIAYLNNHLKGAFAGELGYRTSRRDALQYCFSLDKTLPGGDGVTLVSITPDIDAEQEICDIEDRLTVQRDFERVMTEVKKLDEQTQNIITKHYMENKSLDEIGQIYGISTEKAGQCLYKAFRKLRQRKHIRELAENYASRRVNPYRTKSVTAFHSTRSSVVEDIAEYREYLIEEYITDRGRQDNEPETIDEPDISDE